MPEHVKSDDRNYEYFLQESGLYVCRQPEWRNVRLDSNFYADFAVLGDRILVSRPSGYAHLKSAQKAFQLGYEAVLQCIGKNIPYVIIEDYSNFSGITPATRKFVINDFKYRQNVLAIIFCNASPLFNLSIKLGKKIYSLKPDIIIERNLPQAIQRARRILLQKKMSVRRAAGSVPKSSGIRISRSKEWCLDLPGYKMRFELINDDILHPVPTGFLTEAHIEPIFELQEKVFADMGLKDGEYYLMADLGVLKGATLKSRRLFERALKKWHRSHPLPMLIFYNTNWMLRAAINIARTVSTYNVHVADNLDSAIDLIAANKARRQNKSPAASADAAGIDQSRKYADDIIGILAGINWEQQDPDAIVRKMDPAHPFRPVAEAVSLIKMDMDQLLRKQKRTEKKLFESLDKYKNILNSIEEGYYENDLSGSLTFFNDSLCRILGYTRDELQGINYREISDKDYLQVIYETFNRVYTTGIPAKELDWKLIRKDGSARFVEMSVSCINNEQGRPSGFRGIVRDVTGRILAEKDKEALETRLRHAQKMEAIGTLAGGVAHDLNNILSGIVSYPDLLLMKLPADSPLRESILTIRKSGEKAAAIVQDLLTLARRGLPDLSSADLNTLIKEYLQSPEHKVLLTYHPSVTVTTDLDSHLMNISASAIHIFKILMNLITNAAEALPDGGEIRISTKNTYLDTYLSGYGKTREGEYAKLQVSDNGTGILPEDKDRIFEPFYTKKALGRSGSGLGMAMVWGAVHDHNGYIEVSSKPGCGTSIAIYFPAVKTVDSTKKTALSEDMPRGKNEKILVVDDISEQREIAVQLLDQLGYAAAHVSSGEEAVDYIKKSVADLLVIDMIMGPGMDGLDTYKKIISIRPGQKAIIATGYSTPDRIQQIQSLGAGACLKKPYLIGTLARAVRDALDG